MTSKFGIAPGRDVYRSRAQAVGLVVLAVFILAAGADIAAHASVGPAFIGAVFVLVPALVALRGSLSALFVDESGLRVRNVFRTVRIPWADVAGFDVGRQGLLGCVLLIHRRNHEIVAAFGVQGITGQPRRKSSVAARAIADELNRRLDGSRFSAHAGSRSGVS